jgi:hypothetical protein
VSLRIRYSNAPVKEWRWTRRGQEYFNGFTTFMLWAPVVRKGDLLIRTLTGERYVVSQNIKQSTVRGALIHQEFDLDAVNRSSVLFNVSDATIRNGLDKSKLPGFLKSGYRIFG